MSQITPSPIWRGSVQSPDNFAIMNGLCDRQERGTAQNLRLSTLTFECNHESHACGMHTERRRASILSSYVCICMRKSVVWPGSWCQICVGSFSLDSRRTQTYSMIVEMECMWRENMVDVVHYFRWLKSFHHRDPLIVGTRGYNTIYLT